MAQHPENLVYKANTQLKRLLADCNIPNPAGKRILEIGFKNGLFCDACRKMQMAPSGIDVNRVYHTQSTKAFPDMDLQLYDGRTFPFPDDTFDLVASFQVLEHVSDLPRMLSESARVLKPGGMMYHVVPNYHSFYEGHYKIVWLPCLNKAAGRIWVKILGKYNPMYESLNLTSPGKFRKMLTQTAPAVEILSLGKEQFKNRFTTEEIRKVKAPLVRKTLSLLQKSGPIKSLFLSSCTTFNVYYPIIVICRKK